MIHRPGDVVYESFIADSGARRLAFNQLCAATKLLAAPHYSEPGHYEREPWSDADLAKAIRKISPKVDLGDLLRAYLYLRATVPAPHRALRVVTEFAERHRTLDELLVATALACAEYPEMQEDIAYEFLRHWAPEDRVLGDHLATGNFSYFAFATLTNDLERGDFLRAHRSEYDPPLTDGQLTLADALLTNWTAPLTTLVETVQRLVSVD